MTRTTSIAFGPFRLDQDAVELWKGDGVVPLQPRPLAVLSYLAARPGEVVGRDELIAKVWEGTAVTKGVLKVAVRAIREAAQRFTRHARVSAMRTTTAAPRGTALHRLSFSAAR